MKGTIVKVHSDLYKVDFGTKMLDCKARGGLKYKNMKLLAGDLVEVEGDVIEFVYPRKNELIRPPIANIDQLMIVVAAKNPKPDLDLLDKQLIMAEKNHILPIICINKIDLTEDYQEIVETYECIGYQVIQTDAKKGIGVDRLAMLLQNKITAFTGNSGVGKSTLTNHIFQETVTAEGETSEKLEKGKHTTKFVELYPIAPHSYLADTPGFSTYDLQDMEAKDLEHYYLEFSPYISKCEFRGCSHIKEQNCGVKQAVEDRKIDEGRYARYCQFYEKIKEAKKWEKSNSSYWKKKSK